MDLRSSGVESGSLLSGSLLANNWVQGRKLFACSPQWEDLLCEFNDSLMAQGKRS